MRNEILIRPMDRKDIPEVVRTHLAAFPGFFLTFLGSSFLRQLYESILDDPSGIAFVSERRGAVSGFVAGTSAPSGLYSRMLRRRWWRFGAASAAALVRRPDVARRLLRALRQPQHAARPPGRGTLMSLAVAPDEQRSGAGAALVRRFLEEAAARALTEVDLTTDAEGNDLVQRFYERLGFHVERELRTPEGRRLKEYIIRL